MITSSWERVRPVRFLPAEGTQFQLPPFARDLFRLSGAVPNPGGSGRDLAQAMVQVAVQGTEKHQGLVFENRHIRAMVDSLHTPSGVIQRFGNGSQETPG
jgi:hypothetical protein